MARFTRRAGGGPAARLGAAAVLAAFLATLGSAAGQAPPISYARVNVLPGPPAIGSAAYVVDLATFPLSVAPDRLAQAERDQILDPFLAFAEVLGPRFRATDLPATGTLLTAVLTAALWPLNEAKVLFPRDRPYVADPSRAICSLGTRGIVPDQAYPSGHAAIATAWGLTLAQLLPAQGPALMQRAGDFGFSRVVCGVHWPSDIDAGAALGVAVFTALAADPDLPPLLAAARAELEQVLGQR